MLTRSTDSVTEVEKHVFTMFIAGAGDCRDMLQSLRDMCDEHLKGSYELNVVDVLKQPDLAEREGVMTIPMLVKSSPDPVIRITGDFSVHDDVVSKLELGRP